MKIKRKNFGNQTNLSCAYLISIEYKTCARNDIEDDILTRL
jgi:hypothetical protein